MENITKEYLEEEIESLKREIHIARVRKEIKENSKKSFDILAFIFVIIILANLGF